MSFEASTGKVVCGKNSCSVDDMMVYDFNRASDELFGCSVHVELINFT